MLIVYISKTGKIERFLEKTEYPNLKRIVDGTEMVNEPFILLTGTVGIGEIAQEVKDFLKNNHQLLKGVIGSGNKNWGAMYCKAAYKVAKKFDVPMLMTFESAGTTHDVEEFNKVMAQFSPK